MALNTSHRQADDINRRIVDSSEDCLKVLDLEGRVTYINGAGVRHLGLHSPADLLGRIWLDTWQGEARQAAQDALARARAGGRGTFQGLHTTAEGVAKWWEVVATPITDTNGAVVQLLVVSRDLTDRLREEAFYAGQHHVLEMIAAGAALEVILSSLVHLLERQSDSLRCSVVLLEGNRLRHGAAPSLPAAYVRLIDGMTIGPRAGSCGTAMYLAQPVIVTDIFEDPLWEDYREVARPFGFRACWSEPILSSQRTVLGSFAIYADEPRPPSREELHLMNIAAHLAGIAIEQRQALQALHHSEERNRAMLRAIPDWMFVTSADGTFLDYHAKDPEKLLAPPSVFMGKSIPDILPPQVANALIRASALALEFDQAEHLEYTLGPDEQQRFYEATVVRCGSDKVLSIVRDITDRKQSEMDASAQHRELAHLGRVAMLGELSGALAHELSQPLAAILSNAQAARRLLDRSPAGSDRGARGTRGHRQQRQASGRGHQSAACAAEKRRQRAAAGQPQRSDARSARSCAQRFAVAPGGRHDQVRAPDAPCAWRSHSTTAGHPQSRAECLRCDGRSDAGGSAPDHRDARPRWSRPGLGFGLRHRPPGQPAGCRIPAIRDLQGRRARTGPDDQPIDRHRSPWPHHRGEQRGLRRDVPVLFSDRV